MSNSNWSLKLLSLIAILSSLEPKLAFAELEARSLLLLDVSSEATAASSTPDKAVQSGLKSGRYEASGDLTETSVTVRKAQRRPQSASQNSVTDRPRPNQTEVNLELSKTKEVEMKAPNSPDFLRFRSSLDFSVGYLSEAAKSNLSLRQYEMTSPYFEGLLRIWHPRGIGFGLRYSSTFGGSVSKSTGSGPAASASVDRTESGLSLLYQVWKESDATMSVGVEMFEARFSVTSSFNRLLSHETSGALLFAEFTHPDRWVLSLRVAPWLNHSESSGATTVRSGTGTSDSTLVGAALQRKIPLSRNRELSVGLVYQMERNQFSGQSIGVDPESLLSVENPTTTRSSTLIQFGYHWGKD